MEISNEDFRKFATRTDRPIPGQSLTDSPETPAPHERPPRFTTKEEAIEYFSGMILQEETFPAIMKLIKSNVPIMNLVQVFLMQAFKQGLINPDLMLLIAEPLAYILMGLAEQQGIRYNIIDDDDDDGSEEEEEAQDTDIFRNKLQTITKPKNDEELNLDEKINNAPSLMARGV